MFQIASFALPFFALIALGFAASRFWPNNGPAGEEEMRWLNIFLLYISRCPH
jgi:hypothetical protein